MNNKCYLFKANICSTIEGYVWADSEEEALEMINRKRWDEIEDERINEVDEVTSIVIDNDIL